MKALARDGDFWSGLALAALGAYIVLEAHGWDYMTEDGPGPGFFPPWYGSLMVALSLRPRAALGPAQPRGRCARRRALARSGARVPLLDGVRREHRAHERDGFTVALALLAWFIVAVMARRPQRVAVPVALGGAALFYAVFVFGLDRTCRGAGSSEPRGPPWKSRAVSSRASRSATTPASLAMCVVGVVLGTVIGMLPGLGPPATIAMLLPLTFRSSPTSAMIMLAGIYYGAKYGGSTTSILLNVPGESSSVVTCIDGYQMARKGRAGAALGMAAISSFIAGTFGVLALMLVAPPLARLSLSFSSPEYFALMVMGLAMVVLLAGDSLVKALLAMLVGLWISGIGTDLFTGHLALHLRQHRTARRHRLHHRGDRRLRRGRGAGQHGAARAGRDASRAQGPAQPPAHLGRT